MVSFTSDNLLHCPFCLHPATLSPPEGDLAGFLGCGREECSVSPVLIILPGDEEEPLVRIWNTRNIGGQMIHVTVPLALKEPPVDHP